MAVRFLSKKSSFQPASSMSWCLLLSSLPSRMYPFEERNQRARPRWFSKIENRRPSPRPPFAVDISKNRGWFYAIADWRAKTICTLRMPFIFIFNLNKPLTHLARVLVSTLNYTNAHRCPTLVNVDRVNNESVVCVWTRNSDRTVPLHRNVAGLAVDPSERTWRMKVIFTANVQWELGESNRFTPTIAIEWQIRVHTVSLAVKIDVYEIRFSLIWINRSFHCRSY